MIIADCHFFVGDLILKYNGLKQLQTSAKNSETFVYHDEKVKESLGVMVVTEKHHEMMNKNPAFYVMNQYFENFPIKGVYTMQHGGFQQSKLYLTHPREDGIEETIRTVSKSVDSWKGMEVSDDLFWVGMRNLTKYNPVLSSWLSGIIGPYIKQD